MREPDLSYEAVQQYLEAHGWRPARSRRAEVGIWRSSDEQEEVQVPLTRGLGDVVTALRRVAETLARVEQRELGVVLRDLARPRADALLFGLVGEALRDGSTSLVSGVEFYQAIRNALSAAACSAKRPQTFFPRMGFAEANQFVERCRLGPTEHGSYVVNVVAPLDLDVPDELETPHFGRRASEALIRGVDSLVTHVRAHTERQLLDAPGPVSANLCRAVVGMAPADEGADVRLQARWSPLLASSVRTDGVVVERELYERIEVLGDQLRGPERQERVEVIALVARLSGAPNAQGLMEGDATLLPEYPLGLRRLSVRLSAPMYERAGRAHLAQQYVRATGVLRRVGRARVLEAETLEIVPEQ